MNINLRFGMHRDIPVIHQLSDKIDGLVIPAHILAYHQAATSVFVTSMPEKAYLIDPMTFVFQNEKRKLLNDSGDIRASIRSLCEASFPALLGYIESVGMLEALSPPVFSEVHGLCQGFSDFQMNKVREASGTSKASRYLQRYGRTAVTDPRLIVAPYFRFAGVGDGWYTLSLECARYCRAICREHNVAPVICCPASAIRDPGSIRTIVDDYREFGQVLLWFDDLHEVSVEEDEIVGARLLIRALGEAGPVPEALYGGFMLMLARSDGLSGLSHGVIYTQHKSYTVAPGGGGIPERYYIPRLHQFRSLSQTDLILHQHPELMCQCEVCRPVFDGDPDNIILFLDNPELVRGHFMAARKNEADRVEAQPVPSIIEDLRETHATYDATIRSLPNPDAFVSHAPMRGLDYLLVWADAYSDEPSLS